jgi:hypothetical protein
VELLTAAEGELVMEPGEEDIALEESGDDHIRR